LPRGKTKHTEAAVLNRADPIICNPGPVKAACTGSDRGRAEPEALPGREQVAAACFQWEPHSPRRAAINPLHRLRVMTDQTGDRGTSELDRESHAPAPVFNGLTHYMKPLFPIFSRDSA
jgi:hypothetical protein